MSGHEGRPGRETGEATLCGMCRRPSTGATYGAAGGGAGQPVGWVTVFVWSAGVDHWWTTTEAGLEGSSIDLEELTALVMGTLHGEGIQRVNLTLR